MTRIGLLDHGYIELVETWGSDERIVEAARMSTGRGFLGWGPQKTGAMITCPKCCGLRRVDDRGSPWGGHPAFDVHDCQRCGGVGSVDEEAPGDEKLLRYLWENKHATPFEMAGAIVEVQAPIFVFREWHRHRTQSFNEMSARYTPLPDLNYLPTVERLMANAAGNKQAGTVASAAEMTPEAAANFREGLRMMYDDAEAFYQQALAMGVAKELARVHLPVGRYSRMRASACLRNWLAFLTLRSTAKGPKAQYEIRVFADALHGILTEKFPRTMALFDGGSQ